MNEENLFIIVCPPLKDYKLPPADQSKSKLVDCPECSEKMWYSIKKMKLRKQYEKKSDILLCCYTCMMKKAKEDKKFRDHLSLARMIKI